jgi:hypothetical protein
MPDETLNTGDEVAAEVSAAPTAELLDANWLCDYDGARLQTIGRREFNDQLHEVRECSGDPNHVKIVPV